MIRLHLLQSFLRLDAFLVVPGYARWVMLFYVRDEGFENAVESIDPFDVFPISDTIVSRF